MSFLEKVRDSLKYRRERIVEREVPVQDFRKALGDFGIIAEYKRASPTGIVRLDLPPWEYFSSVAQYVQAFSVLTEPFWFLGDWRFVHLAKSLRPVLAKDFVAYREQIDVAYGYGADAVLIIYKFAGERTAELYGYTKSRGLTPLVEVGSVQEALEAVELGDVLLGINSRDLNTLAVSLERALEIAERVRGKADFIVESGITEPHQVRAVCRKGARGVLIGTALMKNPSLAREFREALRSC
ncbi:indole-3-glycerol-phosphate synthase [Thermoproteus tenax]|uniref:Indole-3-glycerol phosphate synthase n=1 Tax=Thermoproteus tenax (strain ATCC 35583 / DSM 2078 / JCM 9277 / NBRC 100435 / Kra 1) TaxID=768679 RepID=G4RLL4_THETK|nr:indole-3-glycerol-phosphate synthase [Thermoproteus tenax]CCC82459.1 Indole-3-glycerol phosphate synthase [Thermoproteus tenax Kra 1]